MRGVTKNVYGDADECGGTQLEFWSCGLEGFGVKFFVAR